MHGASKLDRHLAEERQSCCNTQRVLLSFSLVAATFVLAASQLSAPTMPVYTRSSTDIARYAMARRSSSTIRAALTPPSSVPSPPQRALSSQSPSPPVLVAGVSDPTCHARLHTDYMGERAPVWGLGKPGFHLKNAAECCAACQAHATTCALPGSHSKSWWPSRPELRCGGQPPCNLWVFCPEEQCFAFDIHVHTKGECWLKQQARFDALGPNVTAPKDPHEGHTTFPQAMRNAPRAIWPWAVDPKIWPGGIPERVPWISGVIAPADAVVRSAPADDPWRKRWCDKHRAEYGACDESEASLLRRAAP